MAATTLGSRAIIGRFYQALEQDAGAGWVDLVSMLFTSDQASETYAWLGQSPAMREWIGGRHAKGFRENGITLINKKFEATLEVPLDWLRRDKTGQLQVRINELAQRTNAHWAKLLSALIITGESTACYDGQYFFDTDHSEGDSGAQSNDISVDISALPVPATAHGSTTAPAPEELMHAILEGAQTILGFKDDQGEPMNEAARQFAVMVPVPFWKSALAAVGAPTLAQGATNIITQADGFGFRIFTNPRLTWTTKFALFRADGGTAPFIRQEEEGVMMDALAEGSEEEFKHDRHLYGVKALRNVGYGYWQKACLVTLT